MLFSILQALAYYDAGGVSLIQTSKLFNITYSVLQRRRNCKHSVQDFATQGRSTVLDAEEEAFMRDSLIIMSQWGYGMTKRDLREVVGEYLTSRPSTGRQTPWKEAPRYNWVQGFLSRHTVIATRSAEALTKARARGMKRSVVGAWFELIQKNDIE